MQDALVSSLVKELQPFFYGIGALTILFILTFGGGLLKLILDSKKSREQKLDVSIDALKMAVIENTNAIIRLELKLDLKTEKHERDINNLGRKVRET